MLRQAGVLLLSFLSRLVPFSVPYLCLPQRPLPVPLPPTSRSFYNMVLQAGRRTHCCADMVLRCYLPGISYYFYYGLSPISGWNGKGGEESPYLLPGTRRTGTLLWQNICTKWKENMPPYPLGRRQASRT